MRRSPHYRCTHDSAGSFALAALLTFFLFATVRAHAGDEPTWRLHAYHLHRPADVDPTSAVVMATTASPIPVLLSDRDLLSETCAIDTVVTALPLRKAKEGIAAAATQSVGLRRRDFTPVVAVVTPPAAGRFPAHLKQNAVPESSASAELRKRDAAPTQLHATGVVDLGVFQAATVDMAALEGGTNASAVVTHSTELDDETSHHFDVSIFFGDFTRTTCIGAAVYATQTAVGNLSAAIMTWVPHAVSPACALRLSPFVRRFVGLTLTEDDLLQKWPPSREQLCHLGEGHKVTFTFSPSQALQQRRSFCSYEKSATAVSTTTTTTTSSPGARRRVRCEVYLDLLLLSWYSATLSKTNANATIIKVAAAVTKSVTPTGAGAGFAAVAGLNLPPRQDGRRSALSLQEEQHNAGGIHSVTTPVEHDRSRYYASPLASTADNTAGTSRFKGTRWCTSASVGRGFWFSNAAECVDAVQARLDDTSGHQRRAFAFARDCLLLVVAALCVAGFSGLLTARVVGTVCRARRRKTFSR
jgi:hypothetical protein